MFLSSVFGRDLSRRYASLSYEEQKQCCRFLKNALQSHNFTFSLDHLLDLTQRAEEVAILSRHLDNLLPCLYEANIYGTKKASRESSLQAVFYMQAGYISELEHHKKNGRNKKFSPLIWAKRCFKAYNLARHTAKDPDTRAKASYGMANASYMLYKVTGQKKWRDMAYRAEEMFFGYKPAKSRKTQ